MWPLLGLMCYRTHLKAGWTHTSPRETGCSYPNVGGPVLGDCWAVPQWESPSGGRGSPEADLEGFQPSLPCLCSASWPWLQCGQLPHACPTAMATHPPCQTRGHCRKSNGCGMVLLSPALAESLTSGHSKVYLVAPLLQWRHVACISRSQAVWISVWSWEHKF